MLMLFTLLLLEKPIKTLMLMLFKHISTLCDLLLLIYILGFYKDIIPFNLINNGYTKFCGCLHCMK